MAKIMAATAEKPKGGVYSLRFNAEELELLKSVAEREDMKISEVIREAIRVLAAARRDSIIEIGGARELRAFVSRGEPAMSGTRLMFDWTKPPVGESDETITTS